MIRMARRVIVITGQGHDKDGQEEGHRSQGRVMIRMAWRVIVITEQGHDKDGLEGHCDHRTGS